MPEVFINGKHMVIKKGHRLKVFWDGREIPGVMKVLQSGSGYVPQIPGKYSRTKPELLSKWEVKRVPVVFKRGRGSDQAFKDWYSIARKASGPLIPAIRKDVNIKILDDVGKTLFSFTLIGCVPSDFTSMPGLVADGEAVGMEELVLQSEGMVMDDDK